MINLLPQNSIALTPEPSASLVLLSPFIWRYKDLVDNSEQVIIRSVLHKMWYSIRL